MPLTGLSSGVWGLFQPQALQSSICFKHCVKDLLVKPLDPAPGWRTRPVPSPRALIGSRGHMRDPEGWNSDLWLLALLFLFKNRWVCGSLLGIGAFDRGWRQL